MTDDDDPEFRLHVRHMRAAGICSRGSREWCAQNGVSWAQFVEHGLLVSVMREFNDPIVNRIIAEAEKERANGR